MQPDVWTARSGVEPLTDELVGFSVEGSDGTVGKVDHVSYSGSCVIVSTGRLLGKKYVIPAWAVDRVDRDEQVVVVDLTKDEIQGSPEYDDHLGFDDACEAKVGEYYEDLMATR